MTRFAFGKNKNVLPGQWKLAWNGSKMCASGIWPGGMGELGKNRRRSYCKGSLMPLRSWGSLDPGTSFDL